MERTRLRTRPEPRRRTGGRSARVVSDVLEATVEALARDGYARLSIDEVATRAGVSRTTVYRRWATKHDLVRAALLRLIEGHASGAQDTGTIRGDLLALVRARLGCDCDQKERHRGLARALITEFNDAELGALARLIRERIEQPLIGAVERAIARGELPAGTDAMLVMGPVFALMHLRGMMGDELPLEEAERLIDFVLVAARAGAAVRAPAPVAARGGR